jgi:hypothetical protein
VNLNLGKESKLSALPLSDVLAHAAGCSKPFASGIHACSMVLNAAFM